MNKSLYLMLLLSASLAACAAPASTPVDAPLAPQADATTTPALSPTTDPFPDPVLKIVGPEEVVFDWSNNPCGQDIIPDLPARAFRGADGQVQLLISHIENHRMTGADLNSLSVDCRVVMDSEHDPDPAMNADTEWIAAPITEDGRTVYAVVHNEYHGWEHPGQCPERGYYPPCWYNTLTLAVSRDGGDTYSHAVSPPSHFLAGLPFPYKPQESAAGLRNPSNIVRGPDGYHYMVANAINPSDARQWVCLLRTADYTDPASWRFWDGQDFDGTFADPYANPPENPLAHTCPALAMEEIGASLVDSLTYNTYLQRYVLVGISADQIGGRETWGVYYSFSTDLTHWTRRKLLVEMVLPWTAKSNSDVMYLYPALLDAQSDSRNFETTGKTASLYYTRHNQGQGSLDRDLIRVPVEFFPNP